MARIKLATGITSAVGIRGGCPSFQRNSGYKEIQTHDLMDVLIGVLPCFDPRDPSASEIGCPHFPLATSFLISKVSIFLHADSGLYSKSAGFNSVKSLIFVQLGPLNTCPLNMYQTGLFSNRAFAPQVINSRLSQWGTKARLLNDLADCSVTTTYSH